MSRPLSVPKTPDFLVGTIAAMRLLSGERQPMNPPEREMLAHLQSMRLKPEVAKRIVATFDAKPRAERQRLLGASEDKSHTLERFKPAAPQDARVRDHRGSPGAGAGVSSSPHAGRLPESRAPLSDELSTGDEPGIRYTVRYLGLKCRDETHNDWFGSDEIYVITSGLAINNGVNTAISALTHPLNTHDGYYGDVDAPEDRVGPVAVVYSGSPDTLSLAVVVMEHDEGDPNYYRDEVNVFVAGAIALATYLWGPAAALSYFKDNIADAINWILDTEDDFISSEVVTWERPALEELALQTPHIYQDTSLITHFVTRHRGDDADYLVGFDIERDPPRPPPIFL